MKKVLVMTFMCLISIAAIAKDDFPGRSVYPNVPYIELDDLYAQRNNAIIIDARSPYEFETLRIKNAHSVPLILSSKEFKIKMRALRDQFPRKKLVFYCNGHKCMKSYKAAARSITYLGQQNVYAFDAGIFDWASKYPEEAVLLGETLKDPKKLISKKRFKEHLVDAEKFIKSTNDSSAILDIRDRIERDGFYVFSGFEDSISLNEKDKQKMSDYFNKVKKSGKPLYIYDMVGRQVRWFQYYVESKGIKEYYFMKGGAEAFYDIPLKNLMD